MVIEMTLERRLSHLWKFALVMFALCGAAFAMLPGTVISIPGLAIGLNGIVWASLLGTTRARLEMIRLARKPPP
jgi:hypothetical protein